MDVAVLTTDPYTTDELGREAHEPGVRVVVRRTGLATDLTRHIIFVTQPPCGTLIDDGLQLHNHLIGTL